LKTSPSIFLVASVNLNTVFVSTEEPKVIGSHDTITAAVGEDVILPCHLEPPFDVHNLTVLWKHNGAAVHTYKSRGDNLDAQDKSFKNRTLFFHGEMVNGNISLKLFNVTEQDKGVYTCVVPRLDSQVRKGNRIISPPPRFLFSSFSLLPRMHFFFSLQTWWKLNVFF
uniref:Ig-like domain-containing protein n=1 Tax=Amphiprion ocellaris TaxID=80972 RepID=A0AAQ5WX58_AMPOC